MTGSSRNAGLWPGSGSGCHFFSNFFCINFLSFNLPVLLLSNDRHLSFIYGVNYSEE